MDKLSIYYCYYINIFQALSTCKPANPATKAAYPTWDNFQIEYCRQGGVVEACPASDDVTNITVDFEIEPNGNVRNRVQPFLIFSDYRL